MCDKGDEEQYIVDVLDIQSHPLDTQDKNNENGGIFNAVMLATYEISSWVNLNAIRRWRFLHCWARVVDVVREGCETREPSQ